MEKPMTTGIGNIWTRKNALNLQIWDPALLWYAKAVAVMKTRPVTDPTSWLYQAAIHGYSDDPTEDGYGADFWAKLVQGQALPSTADQNTFWRQCQHGSWYFLPWHRMYLGFFEKIVRKTIVNLGGPSDWALPYWDYNEGPQSQKLPRAFTELEPKLPDNSPNLLIEPTRDSRIGDGTPNNGQIFLVPNRISLDQAFGEHQFAAKNQVQSFGGPVTVFSHGGSHHGSLEQMPHDQVHDQVGGPMGDPVTAGNDPIFWLHHANIDRLWQVWLNISPENNPANKNPADPRWLALSGLIAPRNKFWFHDEQGMAATLNPQDVLDTTAAPFYYKYQDVSTPPELTPVAPPAMLTQVMQPMAEELPEMVGASSEPTPLTGEAKTLNVPLFPVSGPAAHALGATQAHFQKAYLHVENIRGKGRPASYDVYLNMPEGAGKATENFRVGNIPTFGLEQASAATERHPGNGLYHAFNITKTVNFLKSEQLWNPKLLRVTFVPMLKPAPGSAMEVGRVSLYFT
jgi:tyrosinase